MTQQTKAQQLATYLESFFVSEDVSAYKAREIAAELRRLSARVAQLEAERVPMTDKQVLAALVAADVAPSDDYESIFEEGVKAAERAHGIGTDGVEGK